MRAVVLFITISLFSLVLLCFGLNSIKQDLNKSNKDYKGYIYTKPFENKAGVINDEIQDYYFRYFGKDYFIKLSESKIIGNIGRYNRSYAIVKGEVKNGLWDTNNPNQQSRIGDYIVIYDIISLIRHPLKLYYFDGNNNKYEIDKNCIKYFPVSANESSSGIYNGGNYKEKNISQEDYLNIYFLITDLKDEVDLIIDKREKGTELYEILYNDSVDKFIIIDCNEKNGVKLFVDSLLNR